MAGNNETRYPQNHFQAAPVDKPGPLFPRPITSDDLPLIDLEHGGTNNQLQAKPSVLITDEERVLQLLPPTEEEKVLMGRWPSRPYWGKVDLAKHTTGTIPVSALPQELQKRPKPVTAKSYFPGIDLKADELNSLSLTPKDVQPFNVLCSDENGKIGFSPLTVGHVSFSPQEPSPIPEVKKPVGIPVKGVAFPSVYSAGYRLNDGDMESIAMATGDVMEIYAKFIGGNKGTLGVGGISSGKQYNWDLRVMLRVSLCRENDIIFITVHNTAHVDEPIINIEPNVPISIKGGTCTIIHHSF